MSRPWERYKWFDDHDVFEDACVAVATNADVQRFIEVFEADLESEVTETFWRAWTVLSPPPPQPESDLFEGCEAGINDVVQIGALDGCTVAVEPNGWTGADHAVAAELSRGGRYAALFNSISGPIQFVYAVKGSVVRAFEVCAYDGFDEVGEPLAEEAGLPLGDLDHCCAAALVLMERLTGVHLEQDWLIDGRRSAYRHRDPTSAT